MLEAAERRPNRLLTVWGAYAERVCVLETNAVEVPDDLDPAEVVGLVLTYMTAYQLLYRMAMVKSRETVLVHGAAGRVGTAILELGALEGLRFYGTASARDRAAVERLGAVAIDYRNEDFLARVRELAGDGVDVALDGIGGAVSVRSFRALRPGGRLVVFGHYSTLANGRKSWRGWIEWYTATATVALWSLVPPRRRVLAYRIQKLRKGHQVLPMSVGRALLAVEVRVTQIGSERTSSLCWSYSVQARSIRLSRSACRCPTLVARTNGSRARRRRESWCSYPDRTKVLSDGGCERRCGLGGQFLKTDRSSHRRSLCLFFTGGIVGYS